MPPTEVLIFGNPNTGTPVMQAAPAAAIDLPIRMLAWEEDGISRLAYTDPAVIGARYGLSAEDPAMVRLAGVLATLTAGAVAQD